MSRYVTGSNVAGESKLLHAMQLLERRIPESAIGEEDLFGRNIQIKTGEVHIDANDLDVEFDISFDDDTEANESELILYNLSDTTIQGIKEGEKITITAGYRQDTGVIFSGIISYRSTKYEGLDRVTTVQIIDCEDRKEQKLENVAYAPGVSAGAILQDLIAKLGTPVAVFSLKRDYIYQDGQTVNAGLMESIKKQAQVCGVSAYINKGQIYVQPISEGEDISFTVSADTGLLALSEFEEEIKAEEYTDAVKGYEITMLLQHRITTGSIIHLRSRNVSGRYRVREGVHIYSGTDFITKVKAIECPYAAGGA